MSTPSHEVPEITRVCDVAVVGGSAAGLADALQLTRQRRSVIVIDSGEPRNAPAAHMHGYLGREGAAPSELTAIGRAEVRSYGGEILDARVASVTRDAEERFVLELANSNTRVIARRVLAATGLLDELPDVEGLAAHWGRQVVNCPFCHGFEVRDRRLVQLVTHPMALHPSAVWRNLAAELDIVLHDATDVDESSLAALRAAGVRVHDTRARQVVEADGTLCGVELEDGTVLDADAVVIGTRFHPRIESFTGLGLTAQPHPTGMGEFVATDAMTGATDVPGLYAAGNVTDPSAQVLPSAANGSRVGAMIAFDLANEELSLAASAAAGTSGNQADWDARYRGEQMWSGNPNGTLVVELTDTTPGRALDVGAGEGGDAVWLAEQGWTVTATDIAQGALDRVAAAAEQRGVTVIGLRADANSADPFAGATFDLVTAHYASIPRTPDDRAIGALLAAVAPGGTLLVVGHDIPPVAAGDHGHGHGEQPRPFDPDAYVQVKDVAAVVASTPGWTVEANEKRERPAGSATGHLHPHDLVLRARRDD